MTRVPFSSSQVGVRVVAVVALWAAASGSGGPAVVVMAALVGALLAAVAPEPLGAGVGIGLATIAWVLGRHDATAPGTLTVAWCLLVAHGALTVAAAVPDRARVPGELVRSVGRRVLALATVTAGVWAAVGALVAGAPGPGWVGVSLALVAVGVLGVVLLRG